MNSRRVGKLYDYSFEYGVRHTYIVLDIVPTDPSGFLSFYFNDYPSQEALVLILNTDEIELFYISTCQLDRPVK